MKKNNLGQNLFEFAFIILAIKFILDSSSLMKRPVWFDTLLIGAFLGFMLWKLALQTFTFKRIFIIGILGGICISTCLRVDNFYLFFSYTAFIAFQDVDLKEVLKKTFLVKLLLILIHVLCFLAVLLVNTGSITAYYRNGILRYDFFLGHPNTFSMYVLWTSLEFIYAYYKRIRIRGLLTVWAINGAVYFFTNSNTSMLVASLTVILLIFEKSNKKRIVSMVEHGAKYGFLACTLIFPFIIVLYTRLTDLGLELFNLLNKLFTGRLLFGAYAYDVYSFSLFGRSLNFASKTYWRGHWLDAIMFDNSYIWMFISYGYFYLILFSLGFIWIAKKTSPEEKILIISYTFYGIMESYVINGAICFPLFFIGKYAYERVRQKKLSE